MKEAINSLPVPVSPNQKHAGIGAATCSTCSNTFRRAALSPIRSGMASNRFHFLLQVDIFALQLVAQTPHLIKGFLSSLFCTGASQGVADHLHKKAKTIHYVIRPLPLPMHRPEADGSDQLPADLKGKRCV